MNNRLTDWLESIPGHFLSRSTRQPFGRVKRRPSFDNQSISLVLQATLAVYFEQLARLGSWLRPRMCFYICLVVNTPQACKDSALCRDEPSEGELRTLKSQLLNISCHDPLAASDANSSKTRTVSLGMWF